MASKFNQKINAIFESKNVGLGSQHGTKMEPKSRPKIEEIRGHFGLPSQDASKEAKWRPRSSKMEPKWRPKGAKWRENGAPSDPKLIKNQ